MVIIMMNSDIMMRYGDIPSGNFHNLMFGDWIWHGALVLLDLARGSSCPVAHHVTVTGVIKHALLEKSACIPSGNLT